MKDNPQYVKAYKDYFVTLQLNTDRKKWEIWKDNQHLHFLRCLNGR